MAKAQKAAGGKTGKAAAKKRVVKVDALGEAHIVASFNNIIISLTNKQGQTISWSSAGKMGFKGSKKNTPYAAQMAAADAAKIALDAGLKRVDVFVKGPGSDSNSKYRGQQLVHFARTIDQSLINIKQKLYRPGSPLRCRVFHYSCPP